MIRGHRAAPGRPREGRSDRWLAPLGALIGASVVLGVALVPGAPAGVGGAPGAVGAAVSADCVPHTDQPGWSTARHWNEALLAAIRRDLPAPTVHARNLFHTSVAMWDAWAAFDTDAIGYVVDEQATATDLVAARDEAISYAAFRVLEHRYRDAVGASDTIPRLRELMTQRCYPVDVTTTVGDAPAALGNRIAAAVLAASRDDGANEDAGYAPPAGYEPVNPPLAVSGTSRPVVDPNRWQPLRLERMIAQNGIPVVDGVQRFIGPHWGHVRGFALPAPGPDGLPMDPGPPPALGDPLTDAEADEALLEVIRLSASLDPAAGVTVDASPEATGANPLGTDAGDGHPVNPVTGEPYAPNPVNEADLHRALAEYWADGPDSETPPGHWNAIANEVSDTLAPALRIAGTGPLVDRLEWDVKLYLALNAANHDAAVAAWGAKGHYDAARPITMIRHLGGRGQSTDPDGPAHHPGGLPLEPGLVEVVTADTAAPGGRHEALAGHGGEVAVRAWAGPPEDPDRDAAGVAWVLATEWLPYQQPTFVTPAFAGYVSGHSSFSHASAEVLTAITGSPYFPGGLATWTVPAGSFEFERGPERDVVLQWASYADAADQAGRSRLYGGIHVRADDLAGRVIGARCGQAVWAAAQRYFGGGGA
jgi:hypothetical protein